MKSPQPTMMIDENGTREWCLNGKRHRTDGPAVEFANGNKVWWLNGLLHRTDGPAIEWVNGDKSWYLNGKLHRTDGPAAEFANGYNQWYLNGMSLGYNADGFWVLWEMLKTDEQRAQLLLNCGGIPK